MKHISGQLFSKIRNIGRNPFVKKIIPTSIYLALSNFVLKNRGEKLRKELLEYFKGFEGNLNDRIKESIKFLGNTKNGLYSYDFIKIWLENKNSEKYFNFNGAKLPDICDDDEKMNTLLQIFQDVFLFHCFLDDNYNKNIMEKFNAFMLDGPYGYTDNEFDITVKKNDVVIDAGAWIGDFSAYAASKGAYVYAFEPISVNFELLKETSKLNDGKISAIKKGLGDIEKDIKIFINNDAESSIYAMGGGGGHLN